MDDSSLKSEFRPLVPFEDQSASYVHGFEAGMVWQRMMHGEAVINFDLPVHYANAITFGSMAEAAGYDLEFVQCEDEFHEWMTATFVKQVPSRPRLSIVGKDRA